MEMENIKIIPTWDDGPDYVFKSENTKDILQDLLEQNIMNFKFFWVGVHFFNIKIQKQLKIRFDKKTGDSFSEIIPPGKWNDFFDDDLKIKNSLDEKVVNLCEFVKKHLSIMGVDLFDTMGFHGVTHPNFNHFHHMSKNINTISNDILFFERICQLAFSDPNFKVKFGRPPHGGEFPIRKGWKDESEKMMKISEHFPEFSWILWKTSSRDWKNGQFNDSELTQKVLKNNETEIFNKWQNSEHYILFHSRYYNTYRKQFLKFMNPN